MVGCGSSEKKEDQTQEQSQNDVKIGRSIVQKVQPRLKSLNATEIEGFLRSVALKLQKNTSLFAQTPLRVSVVEAPSPSWQSFSVPAIQIFIAPGILKNVKYENELAALIAFELAMIEKRVVVKKYSQKKKNERFEGLFDQGGLFHYHRSEGQAAIPLAVKYLYEAGYDPRGLSRLWRTYQKNLEKSPFTNETLMTYRTQTLRTVRSYAPLRNPIVRSKEFYGIQKRIAQL